MKHTELEDGDQLVTRLELREVLISIHEDILGIKKDILGINGEILGIKGEILGIKGEVHELREMIRTRWWIPVTVAIVAMIANTIVAILLHH
jgi:hypothetical protein